MQVIVRRLAEHFEWKATDYQKRTVQEIIDRRGGNWNELAMVALAAMKELSIRLRRVHEVNIYVSSPRRGETARQRIVPFAVFAADEEGKFTIILRGANRFAGGNVRTHAHAFSAAVGAHEIILALRPYVNGGIGTAIK